LGEDIDIKEHAFDYRKVAEGFEFSFSNWRVSEQSLWPLVAIFSAFVNETFVDASCVPSSNASCLSYVTLIYGFICSRLGKTGLPFLLHTWMHDANSQQGEELPTHDVIKNWIDVVGEKSQPNVIIAFDSYYLSAAGRDILHDVRDNIRSCSSVSKDRFKAIYEHVKGLWRIRERSASLV
jgi:hypothetical protein